MITHLSHFIHYLYGFHEILEGLYNHNTSKKSSMQFLKFIAGH
jgi:hypothetical protein